VIGMALDGIVGRLLEVGHGPLDLAPALAVERQLGRDGPRLGAIPALQGGCTVKCVTGYLQ
jgi:hypothetical protein